MTFNTKEFNAVKFVPRVEEVEVPELGQFFDGKATISVRGLTGNELFLVKAADTKTNTIKAMIEAVGATGSAQVVAMKEALGLTDDLQEEYVKRLEMLIIGCIEPKLERTIAVKIATSHPVVFTRLADKIMELTGAGQVVGKSKGSGETPA